MHFDERGLLQFSDDSQTGHKDYTYEQNDPKKIGYLTKVSTSAGPTTYNVDNRGNVTSMLDASNSSSTYTVNSLDQVEQEQRGSAQTGNASTSTTYDAAGNVVTRSVLGADASGNAVNSITQFSIDELGRMQHRIENGRDTGYTYDSAGNLTNVTRPSSPPVTYNYDERNRMRSMQVGTKPATSYGYDDDDSRTSMTNGRGKRTSFTLDGFGQSVGEVSPLQVATVSRLDAAGRPTDTRVMKNNPDGTQTLLKWSTRSYDPLGRVTQEIRKLFANPIPLPPGGGDPVDPSIQDVVTRTVYDDQNHKVTTFDPRNLPTVTETDALGRALRVTDAAGDKVEYEYFENGNKKSETTTELRPDGGTDTYVITYDYDDQNRLIHVNDVSDPQHALTTNYGYDPRGLKTSETDAEGHATSYSYNVNGERTQVNLPEGITTSFSYDDAGRLHVITDAKNHTTTYDFDSNGRPLSAKWNDGRQIVRGYDDNDNLTSITDPNGTVTIQTFDDDDRLVRKNFQRGQGIEGPDHEAFTLDDLDRMVSAENGANTTTFTYDSLDRTLSETLTTANGSFPVWHDYDLAGNPTRLTYPSGRRVTYDIDPLNRIAAVREGGLPIASYAFAGSRISTKSLANNLVSTFSYDPNRRITEIAQGIASQTPIEDLTYGWTPTRRKTFAGRLSLGLANSFTYDRALRLTQEKIGLPLGNLNGTPAATTGYTLDPVDNFSAITDSRAGSTSVTTDDRNRITAIGAQSYTYNPAGSLTAKASGDRYTYDAENRLLRIDHVDSSKDEFSYDAVGRRIARSTTIGVNTTSTAEIEAGYQVVAEYKDGRLDREYLWGNGPDELLQIKWDSGGTGTLDQALYPLQDTQASVTALTDQNGAPVERYAYEAYGKIQILAPDNSGRTASLFGNLYTWQGHPWTGSLGFFRARLFDSESRTWLTPDPLQYSSPAANLYTGFNLDGGVNGTDPLGAVYNEGMAKDFKAMHLGMYSANGRPNDWEEYFWDNMANALTDADSRLLVIQQAHRHRARQHIFVNGILTTESSARDQADLIASYYVTEQVNLVYNSTHGAAADLLAAEAERLGYRNRTGQLLADALRAALAETRLLADGHVVVHAHSEGGIFATREVDSLGANDRKRVVLFTYGGAERVSPHGLRLRRRFENADDMVPGLASTLGTEMWGQQTVFGLSPYGQAHGLWSLYNIPRRHEFVTQYRWAVEAGWRLLNGWQ
jgi:YD repeat-containing protein